jgi:hypothetical protein
LNFLTTQLWLISIHDDCLLLLHFFNHFLLFLHQGLDLRQNSRRLHRGCLSRDRIDYGLKSIREQLQVLGSFLPSRICSLPCSFASSNVSRSQEPPHMLRSIRHRNAHAHGSPHILYRLLHRHVRLTACTLCKPIADPLPCESQSPSPKSRTPRMSARTPAPPARRPETTRPTGLLSPP